MLILLSREFLVNRLKVKKKIKNSFLGETTRWSTHQHHDTYATNTVHTHKISIFTTTTDSRSVWVVNLVQGSVLPEIAYFRYQIIHTEYFLV